MKNRDQKLLALQRVFYQVTDNKSLSDKEALTALPAVEHLVLYTTKCKAIVELAEWILTLGPIEMSRKAAESCAMSVLVAWDGEWA